MRFHREVCLSDVQQKLVCGLTELHCTAVEEPGICFDVVLRQHLAALIVIFVAYNYEVNGVSAAQNIL